MQGPPPPISHTAAQPVRVPLDPELLLRVGADVGALGSSPLQSVDSSPLHAAKQGLRNICPVRIPHTGAIEMSQAEQGGNAAVSLVVLRTVAVSVTASVTWVPVTSFVAVLAPFVVVIGSIGDTAGACVGTVDGGMPGGSKGAWLGFDVAGDDDGEGDAMLGDSVGKFADGKRVLGPAVGPSVGVLIVGAVLGAGTGGRVGATLGDEYLGASVGTITVGTPVGITG